MENKMVAAWTVEEFTKAIEKAEKGSFIVLTLDYQLVFVHKEDVPEFIKEFK